MKAGRADRAIVRLSRHPYSLGEAPIQRINMSTSPAPDTRRQPRSDGNHQFVVLIRLPFPRGDFVDPPAVRLHPKLPKLV